MEEDLSETEVLRQGARQSERPDVKKILSKSLAPINPLDFESYEEMIFKTLFQTEPPKKLTSDDSEHGAFAQFVQEIIVQAGIKETNEQKKFIDYLERQGIKKRRISVANRNVRVNVYVGLWIQPGAASRLMNGTIPNLSTFSAHKSSRGAMNPLA